MPDNQHRKRNIRVDSFTKEGKKVLKRERLFEMHFSAIIVDFHACIPQGFTGKAQICNCTRLLKPKLDLQMHFNK